MGFVQLNPKSGLRSCRVQNAVARKVAGGAPRCSLWTDLNEMMFKPASGQVGDKACHSHARTMVFPGTFINRFFCHVQN